MGTRTSALRVVRIGIITPIAFYAAVPRACTRSRTPSSAAEQAAHNRQVAGSIPAGSTMRASAARRKLAATVLEASARVVGYAADTSLDLRIHSPASETFTGCTRLLLRSIAYWLREERSTYRPAAVRLVGVCEGTQLHVDLTVGNACSQLKTISRDAVSLLAAVQTPISEAMDMRVGADPAALGKIGHRSVQQHAGVTRLAPGESIAYANTGCTCGQNGRASGYASTEHRGHSSC